MKNVLSHVLSILLKAETLQQGGMEESQKRLLQEYQTARER